MQEALHCLCRSFQLLLVWIIHFVQRSCVASRINRLPDYGPLNGSVTGSTTLLRDSALALRFMDSCTHAETQEMAAAISGAICRGYCAELTI